MRPNDWEDPVLMLLRELRAYDVSPIAVNRISRQCHRRLKQRDVPGHAAGEREVGVWRHVRILACAWCVVYVFETFRRAAAVYGS